MQELAKIDRTVGPDQVYLVVDAMTGQDAVKSAKAFNDALELDGKSGSPRISTGLQLEDLRTAASEFRFSPVPLRERQPHAKAAIGKYLDEVVGKSGGPLSETSRTAWVEAFRELARAAEEAVR
jgi:hypothetical protein